MKHAWKHLITCFILLIRDQGRKKPELSVKFIKWQSTFNLPTPRIQARIQHLSSTVSPAALLKTDLSSPQHVVFFSFSDGHNGLFVPSPWAAE